MIEIFIAGSILPALAFGVTLGIITDTKTLSGRDSGAIAIPTGLISLIWQLIIAVVTFDAEKTLIAFTLQVSFISVLLLWAIVFFVTWRVEKNAEIQKAVDEARHSRQHHLVRG